VNAIAQARAFTLKPAASLGFVRQPAFLVATLAFLLYLPPALSVLQLDPDAVEFIDLARRFVAGEGFVLGINAHYTGGGTEVFHSGLERRAPLYPLVVAAVLKAGLGLPMLQLVNALLAAACAALVCLIGARLFGSQTGVLAGLLAAASPPVLVFMVPPMSEALAICLTLLATWLIVRCFNSPRVASFALAGACLGLGYLTRPVVAVLAVALVIGAVVASRQRAALLRPLAALVVAAAILILPATLYLVVMRGSMSFAGQTYLYSVREASDIYRDPFAGPATGPLEFVLANRDFVAGAIVTNARDYARMLSLNHKWLLLLLPAWPFVVGAVIRGRYPRAAHPILFVACANFAFYSLTWAPWARRYQLLTLLLLLPFAVDGLTRLGLHRLRLPQVPRLTALHLAIAAVIVVWLQSFVEEYRGTYRYGDEAVGTRVYHGVRWTGATAWVRDRDVSQVLDWINANTERRDILTHALPHIFTFFTDRPSVQLPRRLDPETLRRFLIDYRVSYVLLNNYDGYRRRYEDDLLALEPQGVRVTPVGEYRIVDTRGLWLQSR
jgi:hypothetical protein